MIDALRAITEESTDALFVKDLQGRYLFCNAAAEKFAGQPCAHVLGRDDFDFFESQEAETIRNQDRRVISTGIAETEEQVVTAANVVRVFQITKSPFRDHVGAIQGVVGIAREVTISMKAEDTIRKIAAFNIATGVDYFRFLVVHLCKVCHVEISLIGVLDTEDSKSINTLSVCRQGLLVDNFSYDLRHTPCENVVSPSFCYYPTSIQQDFPQDLMLGEMGVESYMSIPLFSGSGQTLGLIVMLNNQPIPFSDQSQTLLEIVAARAGSELARVLTEDKLRANEDRYRRVLESLPIGVFVYDGRKILYANPLAMQIIGAKNLDAFHDLTLLDILEPKTSELTQRCFDASLSPDDLSPPIESRLRRLDGTLVDVEVQSIKTLFGDRDCVQVQFSDITARKQSALALLETQDRFALFMHHLPGLAWIKDEQGRYVFANSAALKVFQRSQVELYGKTDCEVFSSETASQFKSADLKVMASGVPLQTVEMLEHEDGILHHSIVHKFPIHNFDGQASLIGGIAIDITDRNRAEDTVRKLSDFREAIIRTAAEGICVCSPVSDFPYVEFSVWNEQMTELTGYTMDEINRLGWYQSLYPDPDLRKRVKDRMIRMRQGEDLRSEEWDITCKDGEVRCMAISTSVIQIEHGIHGVVALIQDVTDRKRTAIELSKSADLLRSVAESTTDAIFVKDLDGKYLLINEATAKLVGKPRESLLGKDDTYLFDPESAMQLMESDRQIVKNGKVKTIEEALTANGVARTYLATKGPYRNEKGEVIGLIGISRDISERKAAERSLRLMQFSIDRFVESMFWISPGGEILYANDAACRTLDYAKDELIGITVSDIVPNFPREAWPAHWEEVKRKGSFTFQSNHVTKNGRMLQTETTVNYLQFDGCEYNCAVMRDMTGQKLLEEQLRQSQKMEAVGQLAGGVAHDFNNLLTVINLNCELLLAGSLDEPSCMESMTEIRDAGNRAAQLTSQLLDFSRRSTVELKTIQLNEVVVGIEKMLRRLLGEQIELTVQLDPSLGFIKADVNQLEQVLINLAVNARDAMSTGGRIAIHTSNVVNEQATNHESSASSQGSYAKLTFTDNGTGIKEEILSRIFEPFFTTKEVGKGSGLGLAVAYGIVQQNSGLIRVTSREGDGTIFTLQFPVVASVSMQEISSANQPIVKSLGTVLLVEDEPAVRKIVRMALEMQGYRVFEASNGQDALEVVDGLNTPIDLLLTDVIMPGGNGSQLAVSLRKKYPELPVMFMSGYHKNDTLHEASLNDREAFLGKPFSLQEFIRKVNHFMDAKRSGIR